LTYAIAILEKAKRELAAVSEKDRKRIASQIDALAEDPRPAGVQQLKGELKNHFRIRIGDYRVIYQIKDKLLIVVVVRIGHRREIYRKF
jgi:mRNA interferase RelE/StbE